MFSLTITRVNERRVSENQATLCSWPLSSEPRLRNGFSAPKEVQLAWQLALHCLCLVRQAQAQSQARGGGLAGRGNAADAAPDPALLQDAALAWRRHIYVQGLYAQPLGEEEWMPPLSRLLQIKTAAATGW